jgi:hypothetical protein
MMPAMEACQNPVSMSMADLEGKSMMAPMAMAVRLSRADGKLSLVPVMKGQEMDGGCIMLHVAIPVTMKTMDGMTCMVTSLKRDIANVMLMAPMKSEGKFSLARMAVTKMGDYMVLSPMGESAESMSMAMMVNGEMMMMPVSSHKMGDMMAMGPRSADGKMVMMCASR